MIIEDKSQDKFYLVECSNWKSISESSSMHEAGLKCLHEAILKDGQKLNLSFILSVKEIGFEENQAFFSVPALLQDLGFFKLSSDLAYLSDFVLDKGQNPLNISSEAKKY
jgi:hypothetical protein